MANTPNFNWVLPTVAGSFNVWGGILNGDLVAQDALLRSFMNTFIGPVAPTAYAQSGTMWINNTANPWVWNVYNAGTTTWIEIGSIDPVGNTFTPISGSAGFFVGDYKISAQDADHGAWLICNGSALDTTTYSELFTVIGYTFGGAGAIFNLPDLRGVIAGSVGKNELNATAAPNTPWSQTQTWTMGNYRGEEAHTLVTTETPNPLTSTAQYITGTVAAGPFQVITSNSGTFGATITNTGGNQPHNVMQPTVFAGSYFIYSGVT